MKKILCLLLLVSSALMTAQTFKTIVTLHGEKLEHNLTMSTDERNAKYDLQLNPPPVGFKIYNTTTQCHEFYNGFGWFNYCLKGIENPNHPTSNGTAIIAALNCPGTPSGTMKEGTTIVANTVTQTFMANVSKTGTYKIATPTVNGITFKGEGSFTATGNQPVVLKAEGNPAAGGNTAFVLNTNHNCIFNRDIISISSGGTAVIDDIINCNTASTGTMKKGVALTVASNVTQTLTVSVGIAGTYNISASSNGVTFNGTGTLVLGLNDITLTATGTPTSSGTHSFTVDTTPDCTFQKDILDESSGGTAEFGSIVNCNTSSMGDLRKDVPVGDNVIQVITVNVTRAGSYDIKATANGVTFSGADVHIDTGNQTVVLTANPTDTPDAVGTHGFTLDTSPNCTFQRETFDPIDISSGGTAIVSAYNCPGTPNGTMTVNTAIPANSVTQTITANVTKAGSYNITATANGVIFRGSGTVEQGDNRSITLTADTDNRPLQSGNHTYNLDTSLTCSFSRTVNTIQLTVTGGSTVPLSICPGNGTQTLTVTAQGGVGPLSYRWHKQGVPIADGTPGMSGQASVTLVLTNPLYRADYQCKVTDGTSTVTSSTKTAYVHSLVTLIPVNRSRIGHGKVLLSVNGASTVNWYATASGGSVLGTGAGFETPNLSATTTYYAEYVSPYGCESARVPVTATVDGWVANEVVGGSGRIWLDRNLGATKVATNIYDPQAAGDLYQWGRGNDGHQVMDRITNTPISTHTPQDWYEWGLPNHSNFINNVHGAGRWDRTPDYTAWSTVSSEANPCPYGYRVPTRNEWVNEFHSWDKQDDFFEVAAFKSPLRLPSTGYRGMYGTYNGGDGSYWMNNALGDEAGYINFTTERYTGVPIHNGRQDNGYAIRCIKEL